MVASTGGQSVRIMARAPAISGGNSESVVLATGGGPWMTLVTAAATAPPSRGHDQHQADLPRSGVAARHGDGHRHPHESNSQHHDQ